MKQPDLGKKIAELRQAKGLTQNELAEKCNLSSRTIQRIETAEVTPRSYTVKIIFSSLEYDIYNSFGKFSYMLDRAAYRIQKWPGQFYKYVAELFNLKTNTMKKIMILSIPFLFVFALLLFTNIDSKAQDKQAIEKKLLESNSRFMSLYNAGKIDSVALFYFSNASMIPDNYHEITGRENIREYYNFMYATGFRFNQLVSKKLVITDSIIVDRGVWSASFNGNMSLTGTYLSQFRLTEGKWFIESEMTNSDSN
jgi:transcriptional regulator with XRE-family HTH domain